MWLPFGLKSATEHSKASEAKATRVRPMVEALEGRTLCSFSAPITSPGGGDGLAVADFNNDGRTDVAVFANKGTVVVSLSNGDGTFRQSATLTGLTGDPVMIRTVDVNGDGKLDINAWGFRATTSKGPSAKTSSGVSTQGACLQSCGGGGTTPTGTMYYATWLGNGNGTFGGASTTSAPWQWGPPTTANPTSAEADFNRDGVIDSAAVRYWTTPSVLSVSLGNADGTHQAAQTYAAGSSPRSLAVGDFNGDGWTDIVVVNTVSNGKTALSVLFNDRTW